MRPRPQPPLREGPALPAGGVSPCPHDVARAGGRPMSLFRFLALFLTLDSGADAVGRDGSPYRNYYAARGLAVRDLIEAGFPPELLKPVLEEMRRRDDVFPHSRDRRGGSPMPRATPE